jgi:thiol-disulfide isomerase/thioredoxin
MAIVAGAPALTSDGKPEVLYVGAEYCPYCAAERWPVVIALSRFGTFSGLGLTTSSATDVFPSTPTLTFHGSTYASDVISFTAVETETNQLAASGLGYEPLETLTAEQQQLMQTFNVPPYTSQAGSIPFTLIGNRFVISGSSYPPDVLQGKTWQQIASALSDPSSPIAKQVLAAANMLTAAICELTGGQPTNVCSAPGVSSAAASLPSA